MSDALGITNHPETLWNKVTAAKHGDTGVGFAAAKTWTITATEWACDQCRPPCLIFEVVEVLNGGVYYSHVQADNISEAIAIALEGKEESGRLEAIFSTDA